ncbi:MAG: histidine phosphatase family protein [Lactobacillaceae bacterium]|jgi:probable phosphoglycerate mutase|nr:histidine phosphatase family protein [Lactobacillaceae bacterium]
MPSNKLTFYFFRHGETELNKQGKIQGQIESPLTAEGQNQVKELAKKYNDINLDIIFSSPLSRCIETARPIAREKDIKLKICDDLKEAYCGEWEGISLSMLNQNEENRILRSKYLSGNKKYGEVSYPGGERIKDVQKRISQALKEITSSLDSLHINIGISTHSIIMRHFYALITDRELPKLDNIETLVFEYNKDKDKWNYAKTI